MIQIDDGLENYFKETFAYSFEKNKWYTKESRNTSRLKYMTSEEMYNDYVSALSKVKMTCPTTLQDFKDWVVAVTPKPPKQTVYFPDLPQVTNWIYGQINLANCPFEHSPKMDMIWYTSNNIRVNAGDKELIGWLKCRAADLNKSKVYKEGLISSGWDLLKKEMCANCIGRLKQSIAYDENNVVTMDNFARMLYDYLDIKEPYDIFETLFKHWCWTLKRHIWGKDVKWHLWINFSGAQGIGKSELIRRMCKFMSDFFAEAYLNAFNDVERQYKLFTENYILFFDELNKGDNKDNAIEMTLNSNAIDSIKDMVTKDVITVRQYTTQDQIKVKNQFSAISVANKHLYDIIYDGEAMRRWFDFYCQRETPPDSYDEINAALANFTDALKGIDENIEDGYWKVKSDIGKRISEIQKSYVPTNTSANSWIKYCDVKPDNTKSKSSAFRGPEYKEYQKYCKSVGKHFASMERVNMILCRLWPSCVDEDDIAHIIITNKIDEETGDLLANDITKLESEGFTETNKVAKLDIPEA
jgi:hypothetical protein